MSVLKCSFNRLQTYGKYFYLTVCACFKFYTNLKRSRNLPSA